MIWLWYKHHHEMAISGWMRAWLKGPFTDRFFLLLFHPWGIGWSLLFFTLAVIQGSQGFMWIGFLPWIFLVVDSVVDGRHMKSELARLLNRHNVIMATRAEYIGGHPQLPHGRFIYLVVSGYKENPQISVVLPGKDTLDDRAFHMPLLELDEMAEKRERHESITGTLLATLSERPGRMLQDERVVLNVKFTDPAGRKQNVELTNFFGGSGEVRNWRNALVCAQSEAETGAQPYGPWKSLESDPDFAKEQDDGNARSGPERRAGSAFARW